MYLSMAIIFWIPLIFLMDEGHSINEIIRVACLDAEIHTYVVVAVYIVFNVLLLLIFRNFLIRLETLLAVALIKSCFFVFLRWIERAYVSLSHVARHRAIVFSPFFRDNQISFYRSPTLRDCPHQLPYCCFQMICLLYSYFQYE